MKYIPTLFVLGFLFPPMFSFAAISAINNPCAVPIGQTTCTTNPPRVSGSFSTSYAGAKLFLFDRITGSYVSKLFDSSTAGSYTIPQISISGVRQGTSSSPSHSVRLFTYSWVKTGTSGTCTNGIKPYLYTCRSNDGRDGTTTDCNLKAHPGGGDACTTPVHVCNEVECGFGTNLCDSNYLGYRSKTFRCSGGCQNLSFYRPVYSTDSDVGNCPGS